MSEKTHDQAAPSAEMQQESCHVVASIRDVTVIDGRATVSNQELPTLSTLVGAIKRSFRKLGLTVDITSSVRTNQIQMTVKRAGEQLPLDEIENYWLSSFARAYESTLDKIEHAYGTSGAVTLENRDKAYLQINSAVHKCTSDRKIRLIDERGGAFELNARDPEGLQVLQVDPGKNLVLDNVKVIGASFEKRDAATCAAGEGDGNVVIHVDHACGSVRLPWHESTEPYVGIVFDTVSGGIEKAGNVWKFSEAPTFRLAAGFGDPRGKIKHGDFSLRLSALVDGRTQLLLVKYAPHGDIDAKERRRFVKRPIDRASSDRGPAEPAVASIVSLMELCAADAGRSNGGSMVFKGGIDLDLRYDGAAFAGGTKFNVDPDLPMAACFLAWGFGATGDFKVRLREPKEIAAASFDIGYTGAGRRMLAGSATISGASTL